MRIVIDLQGTQSESRFRGIGRYSLALALGVARNAGEHEIWLVLNGALPAAIEELRAQFAGLVPPERIRVFDVPQPCAEKADGNSPRTRAGELLREHFIEQLQPDAVLVTSLFEGFVDDSVVSVGCLAGADHTAVVLYDLIPFLNPAAYLGHPVQRAYYERKIASLRRAGLLLAISDYSRQEAIDALGLAPERVVAISTAVDDTFQPGQADADQWQALRQRFGIERALVMYAPGGFDARKNIDGLITAFSLLPAPLRARHQLLIASKMSDSERDKMQAHARACGVAAHEVIFTGYVSDADLVTLYRSAALFVFPSKHEGFGLPALEAMACGAVVIGSDATSVPEVIGTPEALFDPLQPAAIAAKMAQVLQDEALQQRLRDNGRIQRDKFSWDHSARKAIAALEARHAATQSAQQAHDAALRTAGAIAPGTPKRRIAFVSPMLPERTGVADYSTRLLPTLLPWFEIELVVQQPEVSLPPELQQLPVRDGAWLRAHAHELDHIVYQIGNSPFHGFMVDLLRDHPGVVVLHDFYLSGMISWEQMTGKSPDGWTRALLQSHGYAAVRDSVGPDGYELGRKLYPSNLDVLRDASHVIVHSEYARMLAQQCYGPQAGRDWSYAQLPRAVPAVHDRAAARQALGIGQDDFVVANFGFVAPTKRCLELLNAWLASSLHGDRQCRLVFVGENHGGDYGANLTAIIKASGSDRIAISGWTSDEDYLRYLQAADVGVQLRADSRGETSGTVLDCMIYRLPTVINANGSMGEFPHDAVWMLPDSFNQAQLVEALDTLRHDNARRLALGAAAFALMGTRNSPERCGWLYKQALDRDLARRPAGRRALLQGLLEVPGLELDAAGLEGLARCAARAPDPLQQRQLLVDVTNIARHDLKTGIERVVRHQLLELLQLPHTSGWRVEAVYLCEEGGVPHYRYARRYVAGLLGIDHVLQGEDPLLDLQAGDAYYCADHSPRTTVTAARAGIFAGWRARGLSISFVVYDLLPVLRPEFFPAGADETHAAWLRCIAAEGDRLICISQAVADELAAWLAQEQVGRRPGQQILASHLGADIGVPPAPQQDNDLLRQIKARPSFLVVSTIEPRKGHLQTLDAFEQLWAEGLDVNLVLVGNEGWKPLQEHERRTIPQIMARLNGHPELGQRLLRPSGVDDATLQQIYLASTCLISPSEGEGFGLPLIEAASYGLPLLLRDIPVFREVAGERAAYFQGMEGKDLAAAVRQWLAEHGEGRHPAPHGMPWRTWRDNAEHLLSMLDPRAARGGAC
ncbi:MAG: glycosyl transferase family 1 [Pseudoduganella sp.]|jgi:glycosyltransferase involved in cell wall biosynthesis|nr:glycosyl transferase family 1 [Pseudoduganella sp.]